MKNLNYIAVLAVTFLCGLVLLLLYAVVSLIAVRKKEKKNHLPTHCILDLCIHNTGLLGLCKVCGCVGAYTCSRNFFDSKIQSV